MTDAERAAWLADKIGALGDYAKEAAAMLRRWPSVRGLTDDQIAELWSKWVGTARPNISFARAMERAHGIGVAIPQEGQQ